MEYGYHKIGGSILSSMSTESVLAQEIGPNWVRTPEST